MTEQDKKVHQDRKDRRRKKRRPQHDRTRQKSPSRQEGQKKTEQTITTGQKKDSKANLVRSQAAEDEKTLEGLQARLPFSGEVIMVRFLTTDNFMSSPPNSEQNLCLNMCVYIHAKEAHMQQKTQMPIQANTHFGEFMKVRFLDKNNWV